MSYYSEESSFISLSAKLDVKLQSDLSGFYRHLLKQTTGEEQVPDVSKVKIEKSDEEPSAIQASAEVDFEQDHDATDSDNSTSSDR